MSTEQELCTELYEVTVDFPTLTLYIEGVNKEEAMFNTNNWLEDITNFKQLFTAVDIEITTITEAGTFNE